MLTPTISSPGQLLHKLERELWRAFHHKNRIHKADHLYNFCVTAQALKDHFFGSKGLVGQSAQSSFHHVWSQVPELVAAAEVANTTKHAVLRQGKLQTLKKPRTKSIRTSTTSIATICANSRGRLTVMQNQRAPSIAIVVENGQRFDLYTFMDAVVNYWYGFLRSQGLGVRRQQARTLYGEA